MTQRFLNYSLCCWSFTFWVCVIERSTSDSFHDCSFPSECLSTPNQWAILSDRKLLELRPALKGMKRSLTLLLTPVPFLLINRLFSQQTFWLVIAGKAQVLLITLTLASCYSRVPASQHAQCQVSETESCSLRRGENHMQRAASVLVCNYKYTFWWAGEEGVADGRLVPGWWERGGHEGRRSGSSLAKKLEQIQRCIDSWEARVKIQKIWNVSTRFHVKLTGRANCCRQDAEKLC